MTFCLYKLLNSYSEARHSCSQDDRLDGYTFTHHDPREGAVQVIKDSQNNVELTIEWLKVPGGDHGGSWAARIKGEPINQGQLICCVSCSYQLWQLFIHAYH